MLLKSKSMEERTTSDNRSAGEHVQNRGLLDRGKGRQRKRGKGAFEGGCGAGQMQQGLAFPGAW